jgi:NAD(P)-dependent dehydrogenase (short-subunit alcohol dehydrogenase family)
MTRTLDDQVVVLTGASSGIGRETALAFGKRGATVVLAARNGEALADVAREITRAGGAAHVVVTDVAEWDQVERLAQEAVARFGRIDTWVNNAGVSIYALVEHATPEEIERVIQVDLLGPIYGMKAALPHMQRQGAGTIINIASGLADRAVALQAPYCAAKAGLKGFTEAFRLELARDYPNIHVTLILPGSINTPFFNHARSKLGAKPQPIPPVYDPAVVADAILSAAETPQRDIYAGGFSKLLSLQQRLSPALTDRVLLLGDMTFKLQQSGDPDNGRDNLFAPSAGPLTARGDFDRMTKGFSLFTQGIELRPRQKRLLAAVGLIAAAVFLRRAAG